MLLAARVAAAEVRAALVLPLPAWTACCGEGQERARAIDHAAGLVRREDALPGMPGSTHRRCSASRTLALAILNAAAAAAPAQKKRPAA